MARAGRFRRPARRIWFPCPRALTPCAPVAKLIGIGPITRLQSRPSRAIRYRTARFNDAARVFGLVANRSPDDARAAGRYVLENDEHIDVLVARTVATVDGTMVAFDTVWAQRRTLDLGDGVVLSLPSIPDLIMTKRFGARARDAEDIRLLEALLDEETE